MRHQISRDLFDYWNNLRGARAAPDRDAIDPRAIHHILADTFLLEVDADGVFPLRVAGSRVNALWGEELRGSSFIDLWRARDRPGVQSALMAVVDGVAPVVGGVRARVSGETAMELEVMLLPLRHFGKTHSRVFGSLSPARPPDATRQACVGPLEFVSMRIVDRPAALDLAARRTPRSRPRLVVDNHANIQCFQSTSSL